MATMANDNPIAEKTMSPGISQKLVRTTSQRLSSLIYGPMSELCGAFTAAPVTG